MTHSIVCCVRNVSPRATCGDQYCVSSKEFLKKLVRRFQMQSKHINVNRTKHLFSASQQERAFGVGGSPNTRLTSVPTPPPYLIYIKYFYKYLSYCVSFSTATVSVSLLPRFFRARTTFHTIAALRTICVNVNSSRFSAVSIKIGWRYLK